MKAYAIEETVDSEFMVLIDGIQWGKGPRDLSGASSQTWPTKQAARDAIEADSDND
jgi:hypothetical protein